MKISILVPVYGVEKYIERCAKSLFNQTYENIEYIFVDDCTKDRSIEILQSVLIKYPERKNRVKIIKHDKNLGLACARNTAIDHATGDYIWHVDSDDEVLPESVELLCHIVQKTNADIVIFDEEHILSNNKTYIEYSRIGEGDFGHYGAILERKTPVYLHSHFIKREIALIKDARPIQGINYGEDFLVTPRISFYAKKIEYLDKPLYKYHHANENSYTNNMTKNNIDNLISAFDILKDFFIHKLDPNKAAELIRRGEIMNKITLALVCSMKDMRYILDLYPNISTGDNDFLKLHHRVLWFFLKRKILIPIKCYRFLKANFKL